MRTTQHTIYFPIDAKLRTNLQQQCRIMELSRPLQPKIIVR